MDPVIFVILLVAFLAVVGLIVRFRLEDKKEKALREAQRVYDENAAALQAAANLKSQQAAIARQKEARRKVVEDAIAEARASQPKLPQATNAPTKRRQVNYSNPISSSRSTTSSSVSNPVTRDVDGRTQTGYYENGLWILLASTPVENNFISNPDFQTSSGGWTTSDAPTREVAPEPTPEPTYSTPEYSTPEYSTPEYSKPEYSTPDYSTPDTSSSSSSSDSGSSFSSGDSGSFGGSD